MEKVKLTREQAEAIEELLKLRTKESIAREKANPFALISPYINDSSRLVFKDMAFDTLIKALYIGYEVEETFKVGDFVDIGLFGISKIAEVTGVKGNTIAINGSEEYHKFKINRVLTDEEKQEEKQRRWWAKHGREVWELREDDILEYLNGLYIVDCFDSEKVCLKSGVERKTNYAEPFDFVKKHFKVVCFAEDRKDVK